MKKAIRKKYYELWSGDEFICEGDILEDLAKVVGCTTSRIILDREDTLQEDGSWSFNFKKYNYTVKKIINKNYPNN